MEHRQVLASIFAELEKEQDDPLQPRKLFNIMEKEMGAEIDKLKKIRVNQLTIEEVRKWVEFANSLTNDMLKLSKLFRANGLNKLWFRSKLQFAINPKLDELKKQLNNLEMENMASADNNLIEVNSENSNVIDTAVAAPSKISVFDCASPSNVFINDAAKTVDATSKNLSVDNAATTNQIDTPDDYKSAVADTTKKTPKFCIAINELREIINTEDLSVHQMRKHLATAATMMRDLNTLSANNDRFNCKKHNLWIRDLKKRVKNTHTLLQHKLGVYSGGGVQDAVVEQKLEWVESEKAFKNAIVTGFIDNHSHTDVRVFLKDCIPIFKPLVLEKLRKKCPIKTYCSLVIEFKMIKAKPQDVEYTTVFFNSSSLPLLHESEDIDEWFNDNVIEVIEKRIDEFTQNGSGWTLNRIIAFTSTIMEYDPTKSSQGTAYIPLPETIYNKKACVNIQNYDDRCFQYSILARMNYKKDNAWDPKHYDGDFHKLNMEGLEKGPMSIKDIKKFEKLNPTISVNVYMLKKRRGIFYIYPARLTNEEKVYHTNLLLLEKDYKDECDDYEDPTNCEYNASAADEAYRNNVTAARQTEEQQQAEVKKRGSYNPPPAAPNAKQHYVLIRCMSRLCKSQVTGARNMIHICNRCLTYFMKKEALDKHRENCKNFNDCCGVRLPIAGSVLEFKDYRCQLKMPFVIYADFETILSPAADDSGLERITHYHNAFSIGYYVKCSFDDSKSFYKSYRQTNENEMTPATWFVKELATIAQDLEKIIKDIKPMELTKDDWKAYWKADRCHICNGLFGRSKDKKRVRDHCHLSGKFRGAAHNKCNLNYRDSRQIPVFFHNLSNYDAHIFIQELDAQIPGTIRVLAQSKEKYISFTKYITNSIISFRFLDSLKFLLSSLQKVAETLGAKPIVNKVFAAEDGFDASQINLLCKKGVFPYEYVNCHEKLEETELPPIEAFYSCLTGDVITEKEYKRATDVWNTFQIQTLGQYSDLYLKTDVLLLADVFENFRDSCMQHYGLDSAHYYTTPGFTWSAMLKHTKVKLDLISDVDMAIFIEKAIRGGLCQISNRFGKANNRYMGADYNKDERDSYLMYFDVNNLYGHAMSQALPTGNFEWMTEVIDADTISEDEIAASEEEEEFHKYGCRRKKKLTKKGSKSGEKEKKTIILSIENATTEDLKPYIEEKDPNTGYILEVDLEYPKKLHDKHKDLPFCPEHRVPEGGKIKKLMATLYDKKNHVIHYRALKQAVDGGLVVKKIHRILKFKQSEWLKSYIDLNTKRRKEATSTFEKDFFKLLINACFGKCMENQRKRVDVKLVNRWENRYGAGYYIARPNFHSLTVFNDNFVAIQMKQNEVYLNKPMYVGLCILDISKCEVYKFHYDVMIEKFGVDKCKLLYTDTDSLIYQIYDADIYHFIHENSDKFDTSNYTEGNPHNIKLLNQKEIGLMKDEGGGKVMREFIGLRPKAYYCRYETDKDEVKKAKGVSRSIVKKTITGDHYRSCLFNNNIISREQYGFRSRQHILTTEKMNKIALNPYDDKRHIIPGQTDTLPLGHYSIACDLSQNQPIEEQQQQQNQDVEMGNIQEEGQRDVVMDIPEINHGSGKRINSDSNDDAASPTPSKKIRLCGGMGRALDALKDTASGSNNISSSNTSDHSSTSQRTHQK
ncbi:hypothetical protein TKK_0000620 [Trichogramma kaykai]